MNAQLGQVIYHPGIDTSPPPDTPTPDEKKTGLTAQEGAGFISDMWDSTSDFLTNLFGMAHAKRYQEREHEYELEKLEMELIPGVPGSTPTNMIFVGGAALLGVLLLSRRR